MPFFSVPAADETAESHHDDELQPAPWVGGVVPVDAVVARSDSAAVLVKGVAAYRDGFELTVTGVVHPSSVFDDGPVGRLGMGGPGRAVPDEVLRVGLVWPDGGRATNLDGWGRNWVTDVDPEASQGLEEQGGSGGQFETSQDYWAWPVPGAGPLQLVVEWPAYGIGETVVTFDGSQFAAASKRAYPVFAEDAERSSHISRATYAAHLREQNIE